MNKPSPNDSLQHALGLQHSMDRMIEHGRLAGGDERQGAGVGSMVSTVLSIVRRRRLVIGVIVAAALLIGGLVTVLMTPMYTAKTTIDVRRDNPGLADVTGNDARATTVDQEFYETQYGLLKARSLARRVVVGLNLQDNSRFFDAFKAGKGWFADGRLLPAVSLREDRIRTAGDILLAHVSIGHERLSRLVTVSFTSPDPALSKQVADAWGTQFIQLTMDQKFGASAFARQFLERRLDQLRKRIDESEGRVVDYASREHLINLPASSGTGSAATAQPERSLIADDLASFNAQLAQATADRIQAESRIRSGNGASVEDVQNPALAGLRQQRAQLAADYAKLMAQFEPDYPPAKALSNQIAQLDRSIGREEGRISGSLQQTVQAAAAREQDLRQRVAALSRNVLDARRRSIQYNIYLRDADTNRQLYDALLQRYKEIGVAGGVAENNISIVDDAELPTSPSSPILPLNLGIALLAGLVLGGGLAWILEQMDQGIVDPTEVEAQLGVPLLGTIPKVTGDTPLLQALQDRKSFPSEAYTSVQASLSFATDHGVPRTLAITSTRPAEGKSTTSYALALSLARAGRRVLLMDADMRSPSVHHLLEIANVKGLSNFLSGSDGLDSLIHATPFEKLSVMTAGPQPPSSPELLGGDRWELLMNEALRQYDHVVIDAPPVMGLADAPIIGSKVEGVVYIVEAHGTQKNMARIAMNRLNDAKTVVVGAVLTKFDARRAHYGFGYSYGYGYGYGDGDDKSARRGAA